MRRGLDSAHGSTWRSRPWEARRQQGWAARGLRKRISIAARGFKFNNNGYPIQNYYITKVAVKRPDGKYQTEIVQTVFKDDVDPHGKECPLK